MELKEHSEAIALGLAEDRSVSIADGLPDHLGASHGEQGGGVALAPPACPRGQDECLTVLAHCLRRARGWRVPPRWAAADWFEELQAEGAEAAWEATCAFNPERGVPLAAFVRVRVLFQLLHHYRKEWAHALRLGPEARPVPDEPDAGPRPESDTAAVTEALTKLKDYDVQLLKNLFWDDRSEAEVAGTLGISQQAVSKRKLAIFGRLRRLLSPHGAISENAVVRVRLQINKMIVEE